MTFGSFLHRHRRAVGSWAVFEHHDVVGNLHDHRHVVLDEQDRRAVVLADRQQQVVECQRLSRGLRPAAGSSRQSSSGSGAHGARDLEAALRAIGQIARRIVGAVDQVGLFQPVFGLLDRFLPTPL
jgi:hypothetical protein